jgi:hypothetical protein
MGVSGAAEQDTSVLEAVARLNEIRATVMPILQEIEREYAQRVRPGYPKLIYNVARGGVFGLNLDPGYGVYFMTDGSDIWAEIHHVALRTDTLSAANTEKFGGEPAHVRRDIGADWTDLQYRNLISELLSAWNYQQLMIFKVDS